MNAEVRRTKTGMLTLEALWRLVKRVYGFKRGVEVDVLERRHADGDYWSLDISASIAILKVKQRLILMYYPDRAELRDMVVAALKSRFQ